MLFWTIAAALVAICGAGLALALLRAKPAEAASALDIALYRAQLAEVERDVARGTLAEGEAETARAEIKRRILEADRAARHAAATSTPPAWANRIALALGALALLGGLALYFTLGRNGWPDQPLAQRLADAEARYQSRPNQQAAEAEAAQKRGQITPDPRLEPLLVKLRAAVAQNPSSTEGLKLLAQNEGNVGNFRAAWEAQQQLVALKGAEAEAGDYSALADLMIVAAGGFVSPEAETALKAALSRDPQDPAARFYMGMMLAQNDRPDQTFAIWAKLLEEGPADAPWIAPIQGAIEELAWVAGVEGYQAPQNPSLKGPDAAAMQAAGEMTPEARQEMIAGMVDGLEQRLQAQGGSGEEWAQLIRALSVLGDKPRLEAALTRARAALAADPAGLALVTEAAQ